MSPAPWRSLFLELRRGQLRKSARLCTAALHGGQAPQWGSGKARKMAGIRHLALLHAPSPHTKISALVHAKEGEPFGDCRASRACFSWARLQGGRRFPTPFVNFTHNSRLSFLWREVPRPEVQVGTEVVVVGRFRHRRDSFKGLSFQPLEFIIPLGQREPKAALGKTAWVAKIPEPCETTHFRATWTELFP